MQTRTFLRPVLVGFLLALPLLSCSSRKVVVEREAAQRTRAEGFEEQFDANGVLIFDKANGARAYSMNCAGCHGDDGRKIHFTDSTSLQGLGQSSTNNVRRFWQIINFGDAERGMKAFEKEASFHDLLDITGFAQTLN